MNKQVLLNYKQHKFLRSRAKYKTWIGGRGSGKTTVLAFLVALLYNLFPRAVCIVAGKTYGQIDSTVLQALSELKDIMGIEEWSEENPSGDYVVGKAPPPEFDKPYKYPRRKIWENCVFFRNGFTLRIVSQTRKDTHRGISSDILIVEEGAIVEYVEFIETVLLPTLRSPVYAPYYHHPWRGGVVVVSSAPQTSEGNWVWDNEEKYLKEQEERRLAIKDMDADMAKKWKKQNPPQYLFMESTSDDNLYFLGDDYTESLRASMEAWRFNVEVMNHRMTTLPDAYYYAFNEVNEVENLEYSPVLEISGTLDFNTDIVWTLLFQTVDHEERLFDAIFVKPSQNKLEQKMGIVTRMATAFCEKYAHHDRKLFKVYGDPNGNSTDADTSELNKPFFERFVEVLKENKWKIERHELTSYPPRKLRYVLMNDFCANTHAAMPVFKVNKKLVDLIIAIKSTKVEVNKSYKKNKRSEKTARRREHATDPTDALDYYVWKKYKHFVVKKKRTDSGISFS